MQHQRPGVTLLEVLIAIFVMGIGMLALLVLFPLGALSMSAALRDDRVGHSAHNAASLAWSHEVWKDPNVQPLLDQPAVGFPAPTGLGYPVYIDPFYVQLGSNYVGTTRNIGITRVSPSYVTRAPDPTTPDPTFGAGRWFSQPDDLSFDEDGTPQGGVIQRQGRHTWAYMVRRGTFNVPDTCELFVVVYFGRSTQIAQGEETFTATGAINDESLVVNWNPNPGPTFQEKPNLRRNTWLMDITPAVGGTTGPPRAAFYRVINSIDLTTGSAQVEVEPRLKGAITDILIMDSVVEVKELGLVN